MTAEEFVKTIAAIPEEQRERIIKLLRAVLDYLEREKAPASAPTL